jgi:hypothetical protein
MENFGLRPLDIHGGPKLPDPSQTGGPLWCRSSPPPRFTAASCASQDVGRPALLILWQTKTRHFANRELFFAVGRPILPISKTAHLLQGDGMKAIADDEGTGAIR